MPGILNFCPLKTLSGIEECQGGREDNGWVQQQIPVFMACGLYSRGENSSEVHFVILIVVNLVAAASVNDHYPANRINGSRFCPTNIDQES